MTRGPTRKLAPTKTIRELAAEIGWTKQRLTRRVKRLRARFGAPWLIVGERGEPWLVNVSLLRAAHAELFDAPEVGRDAEDRVLRLEERVGVLEKRSRAHGAALRILTQVLKDAG